MAKQKEYTYDELREYGRINARIIDAQAGLKVIENVYAVRIHSKHFYALIMNDYLPMLGQVEGDIVFLARDGELLYQGVRGFYKHQHNEFTLIIDEHEGSSEAGA